MPTRPSKPKPFRVGDCVRIKRTGQLARVRQVVNPDASRGSADRFSYLLLLSTGTTCPPDLQFNQTELEPRSQGEFAAACDEVIQKCRCLKAGSKFFAGGTLNEDAYAVELQVFITPFNFILRGNDPPTLGVRRRGQRPVKIHPLKCVGMWRERSYRGSCCLVGLGRAGPDDHWLVDIDAAEPEPASRLALRMRS